MEEPELKPLPYQHRRLTFVGLFLLFVLVLPFLFLYATGYKFEFGGRTNIISTGGIYVAAERTGAEIYIDNELVRETRVFRRAFYAQSLLPGTHRVHVQKEGHHTWVKELPVESHLVTEAQAFNLPIVPNVRIISRWQTATGTMLVHDVLRASTTSMFIATSTYATTTLIENAEYLSLRALFAPSSDVEKELSLRERVAVQVDALLTLPTATTSTSSVSNSTTTKESQGVRLFEGEEGTLYARWIGIRETMPYYYCAEPFPPYTEGTSTIPLSSEVFEPAMVAGITHAIEDEAELVHPVQFVPEDTPCDPVIKMDTKSQSLTRFDFLPNSMDLVLMALEDGVYVAEIDDRGWQNVQPLIMGEGLDFRIENGQVYVYDGEVIYQILLENN